MSYARRSTLLLALFALLVAACDAPAQRPPVTIPPAPERDRLVAESYPTLAEIYQGAQGIYRGCGPNGNVCHNSRQYPNLNTLGAVTLTINQPCNQLQDDPTRMDDWCERQGDTVRVGGQRLLLGYIQRLSERTDTQGSRWVIVTQEDLPDLGEDTGLSIVHVEGGREDRRIGFERRHLERDPARTNAVFVQLDADDDSRERTLTRAGLPAERTAIQFGDPNRNGVYGVGLGNALIVAGHPEKSYLIRRLTDPAAGPLMPLANCCFWSKQSLRALWCWIANLRPDGSNALDPIDYNVCPDGPMENIEYPTPGPGCENAGLCPVSVRTPIPDEPTWDNIYANVMVSRCGGSGCHRGGDNAGSLDLGTSEVAYEMLVGGATPRVVPGSPASSLLYQRLTQSCALDTSCRRMPLGQQALPSHDLGVIARWIELGAHRDGMPDAGPPDAAMDASDVPDVMVVDTGRDDGTPVDSGGLDAGSEDAGDADPGEMDAAVD